MLSNEGLFSERHDADARAVYVHAQEEGEALGRDYLLPASLWLALVKHTGVVDELLSRAHVARDAMVVETERVLADDEMTVAEGLYVKEIAPLAASIAAARGESAATPRDIAVALMRANPPSVMQVFARLQIPLAEAKRLAGEAG